MANSLIPESFCIRFFASSCCSCCCCQISQLNSIAADKYCLELMLAHFPCQHVVRVLTAGKLSFSLSSAQPACRQAFLRPRLKIPYVAESHTIAAALHAQHILALALGRLSIIMKCCSNAMKNYNNSNNNITTTRSLTIAACGSSTK